MSNTFKNKCYKTLLDEDDVVRKMELWEPEKMDDYEALLNSGSANKKRALFSRFYT